MPSLGGVCHSVSGAVIPSVELSENSPLGSALTNTALRILQRGMRFNANPYIFMNGMSSMKVWIRPVIGHEKEGLD